MRKIIIVFQKIYKIITNILPGLMSTIRVKSDTYFNPVLNGQVMRTLIIIYILEKINFSKVVETGTFYGTTTSFFATILRGKPVETSEINKYYYLCAKKRFNGQFENINFNNIDSRKLIRNIINKKDNNEKIFFYLDAHWYKDLPLKEEVDLIFSNFNKSVIVIDDFKVENDKGYGYDDYGQGKSLSLEYLKEIRNKHNFIIYFPNISSEKETGAKRGYVILTTNKEISHDLDQIKDLKRF